MSTINDEMRATADYAIKSAKERLGQDLDLSEQSIGKLENFLSQTYQSLSNHVKDEKTSLAIVRTANIWGAYLGEIIRHKMGGSWELRGSERLIIIEGFEVSPIGFIFQKITNHPDYSISGFIAEVGKKVSSLQDEQIQSQKPPVSAKPSTAQVPVNKQQNSGVDRKLTLAAVGVGGVLLLAIICVIGFIVLDRGGVSAEFKSNFNSFLVKAEKLNVLTAQGVSNSDFRNQLAEVKSAYSVLNNSWPSSLTDEKNSFAQAIKGWDLTLEVWDYGLDRSTYLNITYLPENSTLLKECSEYTNSNLDSAMFYTVEDWVGMLMGTASQHFEQAKVNVGSKLR